MLRKVIHNNKKWDYYVSDDGHIFNLDMHELKQRKNNSGYMVVDLFRHKKPHTITVHRLVAETYLEKTDETVNHIDGDKTNNCVANLEWVSYSYNNKHAYDTGLKISLKGVNSPFAKVSESFVRKICKMLEYEKSPSKVANKLNCDINLVKSIKSGNAWTSISCEYNLIKPRYSMPKELKRILKEKAKNMTIDELLDYLKWPHELKYIKRIRRAIE